MFVLDQDVHSLHSDGTWSPSKYILCISVPANFAVRKVEYNVLQLSGEVLNSLPDGFQALSVLQKCTNWFMLLSLSIIFPGVWNARRSIVPEHIRVAASIIAILEIK